MLESFFVLVIDGGARPFVPCMFFQVRLWHPTVGKPLSLPAKIGLDYKHSSLFCPTVGEEEFYQFSCISWAAIINISFIIAIVFYRYQTYLFMFLLFCIQKHF
jgi:hypothetical protein